MVNLLTGLEVPGVGVMGGTVIRTHLRYTGSPRSADWSPTRFYRYGLTVDDETGAVNNDQAVRTGAGGGQGGWMLNDISWQTNGAVDTFFSPSNDINQSTFSIDLRAKRRIPDVGQSLWFIVGADGFSIGATDWIFARVLIALP